MQSDTRPTPPATRHWATLSLLTGGLWLVLSLAPFFVTTLLGLPFAAISLAAGGWGWWNGRRAKDPSATRWSTVGLGLSCAGCVWQIIYFTFLGGLLLTGGWAIVQTWFSGTPTPTP